MLELKMKKSIAWKIVISLPLIMWTLPLFAPVEFGNGGDSVYCSADGSNTLSGYYSLDYLLTYRGSNANADVVSVQSWDESASRILSILKAKNNDLFFAFSAYLNDLTNFSDFTRSRIWLDAAYGLVDIQDERIIRKLPRNCLKPSPGSVASGGLPNEISITQAVIQVRNPDLATYHFDSTILDELRRSAPLQLSFLLIHEWLWEFTSDVDAIRNINRFLHSKAAEDLPKEAFTLSLQNLGLDLTPHRVKPACERIRSVRKALELGLRKACSEISEQEMSELNSLNLTEPVNNYIPIEDLAGLNLLSLKAPGVGLMNFFEHTFDQMRLSEVDLSHNRLTSIPNLHFGSQSYSINLSENQIAEGSADGLGCAVTLDLSQNQLTQIPMLRNSQACDYVRSEKLLLSGNHIRTVNFAEIPLDTLYKLDLSHNEITSVIGLPDDPARNVGLTNLQLQNNRLVNVSDQLCGTIAAVADRPTFISIWGNPLSSESLSKLKQPDGICAQRSVNMEFEE